MNLFTVLEIETCCFRKKYSKSALLTIIFIPQLAPKESGGIVRRMDPKNDVFWFENPRFHESTYIEGISLNIK